MLDPTHVFVFGSNLGGRHGAGAALYARKNHGAIYGKGIGRQGNSYAIPTKDFSIKTLPLIAIEVGVLHFLQYAREHGECHFQITAIGTGLAGYRHEDIAPLFRHVPSNCTLPPEWVEYLESMKCEACDGNGGITGSYGEPLLCGICDATGMKQTTPRSEPG